MAARPTTLAANFPPEPHAIHGDGWTSPWEVVSATPTSAEFELVHDGPGDVLRYRANQIYWLYPDRLEIAMSITNRGPEPMPFGLGHHPYFGDRDQARLSAEVDSVWMPDDLNIPQTLEPVPVLWGFRLRRPVDELALDHVFQGWNGRALVEWPEAGRALEITADELYRHLVVYTPPGQPYLLCRAGEHDRRWVQSDDRGRGGNRRARPAARRIDARQHVLPAGGRPPGLTGILSAGRVADRCAVASSARALDPRGASTFRDYGVTWDEPGLRDYGRMLVDWYASGFADGRAFEFANLRYYGGGFDIVTTLLQPHMPLGVYETRHLMGGLIGVLGLALAWRVGRHLGGPLAGLLALLLLGTLPSWWGHMFFNSKDIPFAVGMLGSIAAWIRVLDEWPRPHLRSALWLGLAVGLTLGIRIGGIILAVYFALTVVAVVLSGRGGTSATDKLANASRAGLRLVPALPLAIAVLVPAWPWVALAPGNLLEAIVYLGKFPYTADTIFLGQRYPAPAVPLAYWPTLLAFQLTEVILAGLAAALLLLGFGPADERRRLGILTVVIAAILPLAYALIARPTAYNVLRHFAFVLPPLAILAGLGLARALSVIGPRTRTVAAAVIAAACLLPVARIAQLHPYEYVYFNDLSGGVRAAASRFELDYWGTSFTELGRLVVPTLATHGELGHAADPGPHLRADRGVARRPATEPAARSPRQPGPPRHGNRDLLLRRAAARHRARSRRAAGRTP